MKRVSKIIVVFIISFLTFSLTLLPVSASTTRYSYSVGVNHGLYGPGVMTWKVILREM